MQLTTKNNIRADAYKNEEKASSSKNGLKGGVHLHGNMMERFQKKWSQRRDSLS